MQLDVTSDGQAVCLTSTMADTNSVKFLVFVNMILQYICENQVVLNMSTHILNAMKSLKLIIKWSILTFHALLFRILGHAF